MKLKELCNHLILEYVNYNIKDAPNKPLNPLRYMMDFYLLSALPLTGDKIDDFELISLRKELYEYLQKHLLWVLETAIRKEIEHAKYESDFHRYFNTYGNRENLYELIQDWIKDKKINILYEL